MKKCEVVKDSRIFNDIIKNGSNKKNHEFILCYQPKEKETPNFGIAVGTKIGKAFQRNKYKRQIRSIIDHNKKIFPKHNDYIIIMKKACSLLNYSEMENSLKSLIEKVK
ncbi:MAG: ribonuclease P protein component [Bacilli bacterium]